MIKPIKHHLTGKLILSNASLSKMDYGIVDSRTSYLQFISLTNILDRIYQSPTQHIGFKMRLLDNSHVIDKQGKLEVKKDSYGIETWHIGNYPLGLELFELVGNQVEVTLEELSENTEAVGSNV